MKINIQKIYKLTPIISLIVIIICFIFRYSYINILGLNRPLQIAVYIASFLGILGSILSMIDGVNKNFRSNILIYMLINIIFIFTYPILIAAETISRPPENPYKSLIPETEYKTNNRDDAAFILEGKLYEWPIKVGDFLDNDYEYGDLGDDKISLSKHGKSFEIKPTWFTDGYSNTGDAMETYRIDLLVSPDKDKKNQNVESIKVNAIDNNRDFEVEGVTLRETLYKLKEKFEDRLTEDPDNLNNPLKIYYLVTDDNYLITFATFQNRIQYIEIKKEDN